MEQQVILVDPRERRVRIVGAEYVDRIILPIEHAAPRNFRGYEDQREEHMVRGRGLTCSRQLFRSEVPIPWVVVRVVHVDHNCTETREAPGALKTVARAREEGAERTEGANQWCS